MVIDKRNVNERCGMFGRMKIQELIDLLGGQLIAKSTEKKKLRTNLISIARHTLFAWNSILRQRLVKSN